MDGNSAFYEMAAIMLHAGDALIVIGTLKAVEQLKGKEPL